MAPIKTFVTTGILAVVTAIFLTMPSVAGATEAVAAKKKTAASAKAGASSRKTAGPRSARRVSARQVASVVRYEPTRPSFGQMYGLHNTADSLDLKSSVALVLDQDTNEVLFSKNPQAVLPIASLTKLMTALVVTCLLYTSPSPRD